MCCSFHIFPGSKAVEIDWRRKKSNVWRRFLMRSIRQMSRSRGLTWNLQSFIQSINQSINQCISQSINQSIDQSMHQSIDQSINRLINRRRDTFDFVQGKQAEQQWPKLMFYPKNKRYLTKCIQWAHRKIFRNGRGNRWSKQKIMDHLRSQSRIRFQQFRSRILRR